jgi:hypothetical protein
MAKNTNVTIASTNANDLSFDSDDGAQNTIRNLITHLEGALNGSRTVRTITVRDTIVAAAGTVTLTSVAAGTVILVNGVPFTAVSGTATSGNDEFDISGSDSADATALAAAINASTTAGVKNTVTASAASGVVTLTATGPGALGNAVTIENLGVVAQANVILASVANNDTLVINGVTLTAKTTVTDNTIQFARGGTNAVDAAALAALINSTATSALIINHVRALVRSATVYLYAKVGGLAGNAITCSSTGGTMTVSAARLAGGTLAQYEGAQATGTVTISGADGGNYTVTINGVSTGNVAGTNGDDTATAASIASAINNLTSALVRGHVTASSSAGVVTLTAVRGGTLGNAITTAATGTGATADQTRLTGGAVPTVAVISGARHTPIRSGQRLTGGSNDTSITFTL